jgi:hypothetical protein
MIFGLLNLVSVCKNCFEIASVPSKGERKLLATVCSLRTPRLSSPTQHLGLGENKGKGAQFAATSSANGRKRLLALASEDGWQIGGGS